MVIENGSIPLHLTVIQVWSSTRIVANPILAIQQLGILYPTVLQPAINRLTLPLYTLACAVVGAGGEEFFAEHMLTETVHLLIYLKWTLYHSLILFKRTLCRRPLGIDRCIGNCRLACLYPVDDIHLTFVHRIIRYFLRKLLVAARCGRKLLWSGKLVI